MLVVEGELRVPGPHACSRAIQIGLFVPLCVVALSRLGTLSPHSSNSTSLGVRHLLDFYLYITWPPTSRAGQYFYRLRT